MRNHRWYGRVSKVLSVSALLAAWVQVGAGCAPVTEEAEEVGVVQVAITAVPGDVRCIRLTAAGSTRTTTRSFDVTPGASSVLTMNGVPTGMVQFSGEAFAEACGALTPSSVAGWASDTVGAQVSAGAITNVVLTMRRNGRANVSVDFQDDTAPMCVPPGGPCPLVGVSCCPGLACDFTIGRCTPGGAPSCTDGIRNGTETDVDCGGGVCPICRIGQGCLASSDCISGSVCTGGICTPPLPCVRPGAMCNATSLCCSGLCQLDPTGIVGVCR